MGEGENVSPQETEKRLTPREVLEDELKEKKVGAPEIMAMAVGVRREVLRKMVGAYGEYVQEVLSFDDPRNLGLIRETEETQQEIGKELKFLNFDIWKEQNYGQHPTEYEAGAREGVKIFEEHYLPPQFKHIVKSDEFYQQHPRVVSRFKDRIRAYEDARGEFLADLADINRQKASVPHAQ